PADSDPGRRNGSRCCSWYRLPGLTDSFLRSLSQKSRVTAARQNRALCALSLTSFLDPYFKVSRLIGWMLPFSSTVARGLNALSRSGPVVPVPLALGGV